MALNKYKIFIVTLAFSALLLSFGETAYAQLQYIPLEPIRGFLEGPVGTGGGFSTLLNNFFRLGIWVATILAVIMIAIGGVEYMASDAVTSKESAKKKIWGAVWGLLLALGIYLFLFTISPGLISLELKIGPVPGVQGGGGTAPTTTQRTGGMLPEATEFDEEIERIVRVKLRGANVEVNKSMCKKVGDRSCTTVGNLSLATIDKLVALGNRCRCGPIFITGGTEYWLHGNRSTDISQNRTDHRPGGRAVDFSKNNIPFNRFIMDINNSLPPQKTSAGDLYYMSGVGSFLDEKIDGNDPHWHAVF